LVKVKQLNDIHCI